MAAKQGPAPQTLQNHFFCQMCRSPLEITGAEVLERGSSSEQRGAGPQASVLGSVMASRLPLDQSFVVLPKQRGVNPTSQPPKPPFPPYPGARPPASNPPSAPPGAERGGRGISESFVVLPGAAASMYQNEIGGEHSSGGEPGGVASISSYSAGMDAKITALTRVFEIASQQTQVEQPLCVECVRCLCEELDAETAEAEREAAAYEACLSRLAGEPEEALSEDEFQKEVKRANEEERQLQTQLARLQEQRRGTMAQLRDLESKTKELDNLEERYWHDFNDFKLQLAAHQNERDAVCAQIDAAAAQLELLKRTNVLTDAFPIWHDGEFGTINNFRLGRLPNVPVEWDEINAAWGQSCLLLHTMAQTCKLNFSVRIIPLGSYPKIADAKNVYELYGPVNLFWSTRYDKAMVLFLACLKEFADFANARDRSNDVPVDKAFTLPYKIEGDKVGGLTIKQSFNPNEKWTKALHLTLCNLKWALTWLVNQDNGLPNPLMDLLETPASASEMARSESAGNV
ncbi:AUTOPHAGY 6 [Klebsormidium nitens]|uniref:AUTOPHAGY 6 n=1 Tax=Klebsormidium nitens TaxID=105231 RepID=A0A1Y1HS60_KLENI|nr:AUTOPHAGY 6 [Klebsormidium nitens]|eukprot:GAQ78658.1 AUTOPHAGY 6 [Klebsormidium nitens]